MTVVEPVPGEPAALATIDGERTLFVADYHAGVEAGLRYERGVQVPSRAEDRRDRLCSLLESTAADRLVVLGDLMHSIGDPSGAERGELEVLFESLPAVAVTLVKGNHDGAIESWLQEAVEEASRSSPGDGVTDLEVLDGEGGRLGNVGVCHGHSWPATDALEADVLCMGHEHPCVRLEDDVGGSRVEPVWLRGTLDRGRMRRRSSGERDESVADDSLERDGATDDSEGSGSIGEHQTRTTGSSQPIGNLASEPTTELVVFPAFNDLVGGTWINVAGQSFLSPMLPGGLREGEAYLLDGTRLGPYESI